MRLTVDIIMFDLAPSLDEPLSTRLCGAPLAGLRFASPAHPSQTQDPSILYVGDADQLEATAEGLDRLTLLCAGQPSQKLLERPNCDIIWTRDTSAFAAVSLLRRASELFEKYNEWHLSLERALGRAKPLNELMKLSSEIVGRPMILWDLNHPQTLYTEIPEDLHVVLDGFEENLDKIASALSFADTSAERSAGEPYLLVTETEARERILCHSLSVGETRIAALALCEIGRPFCDRDYALLRFLGGLFQAGIKRDISAGISPQEPLSAEIVRLLDGHIIKEYFFQHALSEFGWKPKDIYMCLVVEPEDSCSEASLAATAARARGHFPGIVHVVHNGCIVLVANLARMNCTDLRVIDAVSKEYDTHRLHARIGASTPFQGITNLCYFRRQAERAIELGSRYRDSCAIFSYADYMLDGLVESCLDGTAASTLFPPNLHMLEAYDDEHRTDYIYFLRDYVMHDFQVEPTCASQFVSRNTAFSKLKKIKEVTGLDLADFDTRLLLKVSQHAMDWADGTLFKEPPKKFRRFQPS